MVGVDKSVSDDDVFSAGGIEDDNLGDVIGGEGLDSTVRAVSKMRNFCAEHHRLMGNIRVDSISLGLVAIEADNGELLGTRVRLGRQNIGWGMVLVTVSTWPGSTSMTRTRLAMSSLRRDSEKLRTAALVAQ